MYVIYIPPLPYQANSLSLSFYIHNGYLDILHLYYFSTIDLISIKKVTNNYKCISPIINNLFWRQQYLCCVQT